MRVDANFDVVLAMTLLAAVVLAPLLLEDRDLRPRSWRRSSRRPARPRRAASRRAYRLRRRPAAPRRTRRGRRPRRRSSRRAPRRRVPCGTACPRFGRRRTSVLLSLFGARQYRELRLRSQPVAAPRRPLSGDPRACPFVPPAAAPGRPTSGGAATGSAERRSGLAVARPRAASAALRPARRQARSSVTRPAAALGRGSRTAPGACPGGPGSRSRGRARPREPAATRAPAPRSSSATRGWTVTAIALPREAREVLADLAQHLEGDALRGEHVALALAVRARLAEHLHEILARALARHLDEARAPRSSGCSSAPCRRAAPPGARGRPCRGSRPAPCR